MQPRARPIFMARADSDTVRRISARDSHRDSDPLTDEAAGQDGSPGFSGSRTDAQASGNHGFGLRNAVGL